MRTVIEKPGPDLRASVAVKGKGINLGLPSVLGLTPPVTVQFQSETGQCWESVHEGGAIHLNKDNIFSATASR